MKNIIGSASCAFAAFDTRSGSSFTAIVQNLVKNLFWHNIVESGCVPIKVELLVKILLNQLVIYRNFFLSILFTPLESSESVIFGQRIDMNQFSS